MSIQTSGEDRQAQPMPTDMNARELLRWSWRQLTSMRTALVLLLLLALAAIPGSVVPQEDVDALAVSRWKDAHPDLIAVAATSLDEPARFAPHVLTYRANALTWDDIDPSLQTFERMPTAS